MQKISFAEFKTIVKGRMLYDLKEEKFIPVGWFKNGKIKLIYDKDPGEGEEREAMGPENFKGGVSVGRQSLSFSMDRRVFLAPPDTWQTRILVIP